MFKLSFKVRHKDCFETALSIKFPKHHITVIDIQSNNPAVKQYFYYITGDSKKFDALVSYLAASGGYKSTKEIERSGNTLLLLVVLKQRSYIQNVIQKYHGFFIDLHTVSEGYEYWHIGVVDRVAIDHMLKELRKMGELKILYIGEVDFSHSLLPKQQKKVLLYAYEQGYYELPRKTTISEIAEALHLNSSTVGEHLLKAENKLITSMARRI